MSLFRNQMNMENNYRNVLSHYERVGNYLSNTEEKIYEEKNRISL